MNPEHKIITEALHKALELIEELRDERNYWARMYMEYKAKQRELSSNYCVCDEPDCPCHNDGSAPEPNPLDEHGYEEMIEKTLAKDVGESGEAI